MLPVMATGCLFVAAYLILFPGSKLYFSFPSSVPAALAKPMEADLRPDVENPQPQAEVEGESFFEIAEFSGPGDTLFSLLHSNLSDEAAAREVTLQMASIIQGSQKKQFDGNTALDEGTLYSITLARDGQFLKATLHLDPAHVFHAVAKKDGIRAWREVAVLEFKKESLSVVVDRSVSDALHQAGEDRELVERLKHVFRWDIDFQSESRKGDVCKILFERKYADDRPSGYGDILYAVYEGKRTGRKTAVRFKDKYYDEKGRQLRKDFLRSPLGQLPLRITSPFGGRLHPIRKVWHKHNGVDYGAPRGTPVLSVAKGTVKYAGWAKGYGRWVCVRHENGYESQYGHLSRIMVKKGQRVTQRHKIGLVGSSGESTGPHLDFRLLVKGKYVNPTSKVRRITTLPGVPAPLRPRFEAVTQEMKIALGNLLATDQSFMRAGATLQ